jgi:hypothetical protein
MKAADVPGGRLSSASERLRTRRMSDSMRLPTRPQFPSLHLGTVSGADHVRRPLSRDNAVIMKHREEVRELPLPGPSPTSRSINLDAEPRAAPLGAMLLATAVQSLNRADALLMDAHRRTANRTAAYQATLQPPGSPQGPGSPSDARSAATQIAQVLAEVEQQQEPIWGLFSERTTVLGGLGPEPESESDEVDDGEAEVGGSSAQPDCEPSSGSPVPPLDPEALKVEGAGPKEEAHRVRTKGFPSPQPPTALQGHGSSSGNPSPSSAAVGRTPTTARRSDRPSPRTIESEIRRTHIQELVRAAHEERRKTETGTATQPARPPPSQRESLLLTPSPRASTTPTTARPSILETPTVETTKKRQSSASWLRQPTPPERSSTNAEEVHPPVDQEVDALPNQDPRGSVTTPSQSRSASMSDSALFRQPSTYLKRRNLVLLGTSRRSTAGSTADAGEEGKAKIRSLPRPNLRRLTEADAETENQGKYRLLEQVQRELNDRIGLRFTQLAHLFHDKPPPPVPSYSLLHPVEFMEVADWEELPSSIQQWFIVRRFSTRD